MARLPASRFAHVFCVDSPSSVLNMHAFLSSVFPVLFSEIGDKTQLLTLFLAARFAQKYAIIAGMLVATLLNHVVSAWFGVALAAWATLQIMSWIVGVSFIIVGLWLLKPDKDDDIDSRYVRYGAFGATLLLFFIAEIGDKTQIATILLAARYHNIVDVVAGSTLGILLANVPVIFFGAWLMNKLPLKTIRIGACVLFCLLGVLTLLHVWN